MARIENKTTRVLLKWVLYLSLLGLMFLIALVLDRDSTHEIHKNKQEKMAAAIGAFITLGLYSFLFGENEIYRFIEHLIVGVVFAVGLAITMQEAINPMWLKPVGQGLSLLTAGGLDPSVINPHVYWGVGCAGLGFVSLFVLFGLRLPLVGWISSIVLFGVSAILFEWTRATTGGTWDWRLLWLLVPIPGSLWYMIYSKQHIWLSRIVIVLMIGAFLGKAFQEFFANLLSQLHGTFKPLWEQSMYMEHGFWRALWEGFGNLLFVLVAFFVLFYFVFTFRIGDHPTGRRMHTVSRIFMMVAFGIVFGTVVGTRMGLVVDRIYFLVEEWAKPIIFSWF